MGPLSMKRQLDRVMGYLEKGRKEGAKLVTGGGRPKDMNLGYYVEPTIFSNVNSKTVRRHLDWVRSGGSLMYRSLWALFPAVDQWSRVRR